MRLKNIMKNLILSEDEEKLYFEANGLISIPENYFFNYKKVKYLELLLPKIRDLRHNNFMFFSNVTNLKLITPSLIQIDHNSIYRLVGLTVFHLEAASLRTLPDLFMSIRNLRSVTLIIPQVKFIPEFLFHNNDQIEHIILTAMCWRFPKSITANFKALRYLEINNSVSYGILNNTVNAPKLKSLNLNHLSFQINIDCKHIINLTTLNLQYCEIKSLSFLKVLVHLKYLNLSHNQIILKPYTFSNNSALEHLNISYNNLGIIGVAYFKGLKNLLTLKMQKCSIFFYKTKFQHESVNLIGFDFSINYLKVLRNGFFRPLKCLLILDLSNDSLKQVEDSIFSYLENLQILDLSDNIISSLPNGIFARLINLTFLHLNNNSLMEFNSIKLFDINQIYSVRSLKLASNLLEDLTDDNFTMMPTLTSLNLEKNILKNLHRNCFNSLNNLTDLNLNFNKITNLNPYVFMNLTSLISLTLRSNCISRMEKGIFDQLQCLSWLDLGQNFITTLDEDLLKFATVLKYLYLDNNRLTSIPQHFFRSTYQLTNLNVAWNDLESLSSDLFFNSKILHNLDIDNSLLSIVDRKLSSKINILD